MWVNSFRRDFYMLFKCVELCRLGNLEWTMTFEGGGRAAFHTLCITMKQG